MLKKLTIRNFKAIQDMTIEFTPLTVLIGENSCGKTTILQAIDFLRSAAFRDIPEYLREKGWSFAELKSQLNGGINKPIEFITTWNFIVKGQIKTIVWTFSIDLTHLTHDLTQNWYINETIINQTDNKFILSYHSNAKDNTPSLLGSINIQSSALKYLAGTSVNTDEINKLSFFLSDSANFEVLSPDKIREGKKIPYTKNIGVSGETLAYCIEKMNEEEKRLLNNTVSGLIGPNIEVQTYDHGAKVELMIEIESKENSRYINSLHISDGLLRIIAFVVISMKKTNMILLDEIENGINPYLTQNIISLLREIMEEPGRQVILTTHSPVMLNDFRPEEIVFLWKDRKGAVNSRRFFDTEAMCEALSFLNPGEIWENYGKDTILTKMGVKPENM